jgi:SSS family solute:Na+ symporter
VPNDLFYVDNDLVGAGFDGWATLVSAVAGIAAFVVTALVTTSAAEEELDLLELDRMRPEEPEEVVVA